MQSDQDISDAEIAKLKNEFGIVIDKENTGGR